MTGAAGSGRRLHPQDIDHDCAGNLHEIMQRVGGWEGAYCRIFKRGMEMENYLVEFCNTVMGQSATLRVDKLLFPRSFR
jgi:hypothetical protein